MRKVSLKLEQGSFIKLSNEIGVGGEGRVYRIEKYPSRVAKIYHSPITNSKAEKLRFMRSSIDDRLSRFAVWIDDLIVDENGSVVGFVMPFVNAKEIHELYSIKSRKLYFPDATWEFLVKTAANLANAFDALHERGHVMGDINQGNCVVEKDSSVKLIDCDSFAIVNGDYQYPCGVGVSGYLAPELFGSDLSKTRRTKEQDQFGLAVLIFQLLFLGRHPFAGVYRNGSDVTIETSVSNYHFAYGKNADLLGVEPPPGSLRLTDLSPRIAELFENAFSLKGVRPTAFEWVNAIEELSRSLATCEIFPGHHYYSENGECPWCRIETYTRVGVFPFRINLRDSKQKEVIEKLDLTFEKIIPREFLALAPHTSAKINRRLGLRIAKESGLFIIIFVVCFVCFIGFFGIAVSSLISGNKDVPSIGGSVGFIFACKMLVNQIRKGHSFQSEIASLHSTKIEEIERKIKGSYSGISLLESIALLREKTSTLKDYLISVNFEELSNNETSPENEKKLQLEKDVDGSLSLARTAFRECRNPTSKEIEELDFHRGQLQDAALRIKAQTLKMWLSKGLVAAFTVVWIIFTFLEFVQIKNVDSEVKVVTEAEISTFLSNCLQDDRSFASEDSIWTFPPPGQLDLESLRSAENLVSACEASIFDLKGSDMVEEIEMEAKKYPNNRYIKSLLARQLYIADRLPESLALLQSIQSSSTLNPYDVDLLANIYAQGRDFDQLDSFYANKSVEERSALKSRLFARRGNGFYAYGAKMQAIAEYELALGFKKDQDIYPSLLLSLYHEDQGKSNNEKQGIIRQKFDKYFDEYMKLDSKGATALIKITYGASSRNLELQTANRHSQARAEEKTNDEIDDYEGEDDDAIYEDVP